MLSTALVAEASPWLNLSIDQRSFIKREDFIFKFRNLCDVIHS